jgi:hypothetical protein
MGKHRRQQQCKLLTIMTIRMVLSTNNHPKEIIIDPSFTNNPCLKGVYDKLEASSTFKKSIKQI